MSQRSKSSRQRSQNTSNVAPKQSSQNNGVSDEVVNKCVRYIVSKMGSNVPMKRAQIVQNIFKDKPGRTFDTVIERASDILKNVYGLKLEIIDDTSTKKYFVTNLLQHQELIESSSDEDFKNTVTFLVLTHIFMSKNSSTDTSLWDFLKEFSINQESEIEGDENVNNFVTKTLVKQQYVVSEANGAQHDDGEIKKKFSWGTRAEESVSKMKILKFVSKMYDNINVKSWPALYEEAKNQFAQEEAMQIV